MKACFIRYPNTSKSFKYTWLRVVFSTYFSVFGYLMNHTFSCLIVLLYALSLSTALSGITTVRYIHSFFTWLSRVYRSYVFMLTQNNWRVVITLWQVCGFILFVVQLVCVTVYPFVCRYVAWWLASFLGRPNASRGFPLLFFAVEFCAYFAIFQNVQYENEKALRENNKRNTLYCVYIPKVLITNVVIMSQLIPNLCCVYL